MNLFDAGVISFFQGVYGHSAIFDGFVGLLTRNCFLKDGFLISLLWWIWFQPGEKQENRRKHLVASVLGGIVAAGVARYLVLVLPFRMRPIEEPALHSLFPIQINSEFFAGCSSFPSDHAVLFFAIAGGLFFVSRLTGILGCCWVLLLICLPRVYLGFHYATDILAGAAIGLVIAWIANTPRVRDRVSRWPMAWLRRHCASFYAVAFLLCWQIATLFYDIRDLGKSLFQAFLS
jgi:undecaprenyl-diphosphatase